MSNLATRRALFRVGAKALRAISDHKLEDVYACPICRDAFGERAVEGPKPALTLEHAPPERLNGAGLLLTCERCNSGGGHSLDAEAINRRELTEALRALIAGVGSYRGRATARFGDERVAGDLIVHGCNIRLNISNEATDPRAAEEARSRVVEHSERDEQVQFTIRPDVGFRPRESKLGDLRAAYLVAFAKFGYSYAFDPRLVHVRQQIRNAGEEIYTLDFWAWDRAGPQDQRRIYLLREELVLAVQIGHAWVFLPCPDSPENAVQRVARRVGRESLSGLPVEWPERFELAVDFFHQARDLSPLIRLVRPSTV